MPTRPDVVQLLYSGTGGMAGVCFPLAAAGAAEARHHMGFFGVEPVAQSHIQMAEAAGIPWRGWLKRGALSLAEQKEITAWLVEVAPLAVLVHNLPLLLPAVRKAARQVPGMRIIAVEHHCNALKTRKDWLFSAASLRLADSVVYLTETYRDEVRAKLGPLFVEEKSTVISNGLDLSLYAASTGTAPRPVAGMLGRMVGGKDFDLLIRAAAAARRSDGTIPFALRFAGDGPRRPEFEALAKELGLTNEDVHFCGLLDKPALACEMARWDICAHASSGETMSIALMEAMACSLPLVATDVPGVGPMIQTGENGLLVPWGKPEAFAKALTQLAEDAELRRRMGAAAREHAAVRYSDLRMWSAYRELISHSGQPATTPRQRLRTAAFQLLRPARQPRPGLPVLMFHGFTDRVHGPLENTGRLHQDIRVFDRLCRHLSRHYHVLPLDEAARLLRLGQPLPPRAVCLTFDDGYASNARLALPVLRRHGVSATVFITTGFVENGTPLPADRVEFALARTALQRLDHSIAGQRLDLALDSVPARRHAISAVISAMKALPQHDLLPAISALEHALGVALADHPEMPDIYRPLTWAEACTLRDSGLVTLGAHTHQHLILGRCTDDLARQEMETCATLLRERTGTAPGLFAYPNGKAGDHTPATRALLEGLGYHTVVTTDPGFNTPGTDPLALHRFGDPESPAHLDFLLRRQLRSSDRQPAASFATPALLTDNG